jgi:hypothetical protein
MAQEPQNKKYAKAAKIGRELDAFFAEMFSGPGDVLNLWNDTARAIDDKIWDGIDSVSDIFIEANKSSASPVLKGLANKLERAMAGRIEGKNAVEKFNNLKSDPTRYLANFDPSKVNVGQSGQPLPVNPEFINPTEGILPGARRDQPAQQTFQNQVTNSGIPGVPRAKAQPSRSESVSVSGAESRKSNYVDPSGNVSKGFDLNEFTSSIKNKIEAENARYQAENKVAGDLNTIGLEADVNARRAQTIKNLNQLSQAVGIGLNLGDMFAASRDRRRSENLRDQIQEPSFAIRGQNRGLLRELRDAETRRINPYGQVAPVQDQINLGYQQDLAQAQGVSGGQASTMGALGGAASLRRDRNLGQLANAAAGAVGQQDQRVSNLLQQQVADDSNRDYLGLFKYQTDNNRAIQEGSAVGSAIASSRLREIQSRNNMLNNLLSSDVFDVNTYSNMIRNNAIKNWGNQ